MPKEDKSPRAFYNRYKHALGRVQEEQRRLEAIEDEFFDRYGWSIQEHAERNRKNLTPGQPL